MEDPEAGTVQVWAWVLWIAAIVLWFVEMRAIGFSKVEHDDRDPVSAAPYNHQQNLVWADHLFWTVVIPIAAALIGAAMVRRHHRPGQRALAAAIGALLGAAVVGGVNLYQSVETMRAHFVF